jgi:hypothetical protein
MTARWVQVAGHGRIHVRYPHVMESEINLGRTGTALVKYSTDNFRNEKGAVVSCKLKIGFNSDPGLWTYTVDYPDPFNHQIIPLQWQDQEPGDTSK